MAHLCHLRDAIVRSRKCDLLDELPSDSGVETRGMGAVRFGCLGAGREGGGEIAEMAGQEARVRLGNELNQAILGESPLLVSAGSSLMILVLS